MRHHLLTTTTSLLALLCAAPALAQALPGADQPVATAAQPGQAPDETTVEPLVVTTSRSAEPTPADRTGASVTVIDAQALQQRQTRSISDVLRDVPGVAVSRVGAVGNQTQVRLRGGEANHTLVLIDGIEASDPFQGEFDFSTLIADDIARVEVLRGQQSAIYGSDAIGGVVSYTTATGAEAPGVSGRAEVGTYGTYNGAARLGGVSGGLDYAISAAINRTNGSETAREGIGGRNLDADTRALSAKLNYAASEALRFTAVGRYSRNEADTNPQDFDFTSPTFGFVVDGTDDVKTRALYGLARAELDLLDGRWTHRVTGQINDTDQDSRTSGSSTFATTGQRLKGSYDTTFRFGSAAVRQSVTLAADVERERFRNLPLFGAGPANLRRQTDNVGLVAEYDARGERFGFGASVRHDDNDRFGDKTTYRVRGAFAVTPAVSLRAAAGSGIKNPTNFELFGFDPTSFIGNPDLKPELSEGWEAGADFTLLDAVFDGGLRLGATYFDSELKNEIFTAFLPGFVSTPANRATKSKQDGVEVFAGAALGRGLRLDLAYTYLDAEENGVEEVRRARHTASGNLAWRSADQRLGAVLTVRYNGRQLDNNFTLLPLPPVVKLDEFVLVNLAGDLRLTNTVQLFGRVENLLDEDYEEVFTYRAPGRSAAVGVRLAL